MLLHLGDLLLALFSCQTVVAWFFHICQMKPWQYCIALLRILLFCYIHVNILKGCSWREWRERSPTQRFVATPSYWLWSRSQCFSYSLLSVFELNYFNSSCLLNSEPTDNCSTNTNRLHPVHQLRVSQTIKSLLCLSKIALTTLPASRIKMKYLTRLVIADIVGLTPKK